MTDEEIVNWAKNTDWMRHGGIYHGFDEEKVHGETYDVRAGNLLIISKPDGKRDRVQLNVKKEIVIGPFRCATVQSFEKIKLPLDMYGELWIRNALQHQGLAFTGGDIDPGYWGYLYIKIHNLGPAPIYMRFQEEIASIRFVKMHKPASRAYTASEITEPGEHQLPPSPPVTLYDWLQLSTKLDDLSSSLHHVEKVHDLFLLAGLSGIFIGVVIVLINELIKRLLPIFFA